jgi:predicted metal-dependent phosphoesterase TrpH
VPETASAAPTFDLQSHSRHSDGELEPAEVVRLAAAAGVTLLALSDHDTVAGVDEALAAGEAQGIRVVTACELSSVDPMGEDLHVLGYGIDHRDERLAARLAEFRADRGRRADRMMAALRELGFELDEREIDARRAAGQPIGRPHLAQAVVACPANAARLQAEGLTEFNAFLVAYLIEGTPAFRGREVPAVAEAIATIHDAGGVAVWAHPFWDVSADEGVLATIDRFVAEGLDGVETFYVTHDEAQTRLLAERCDALGLLSTGSSDFHGPGHRLFSRFRAHRLFGLTPRLGAIGE